MTRISDLINEISMGPFGSDIKVDSFVNYGVPVLNGSNVNSVKLTERSFNYVTTEKADSLKKANARRGDIVVTHRGTLGQISYIPEDSKFDRYVISQSQFRVSLKKNLINPIYFTYYFHTKEGQKRLLSFKSHVGVPALAQATTNFRLLQFPLPPLANQDKVVSVLTLLDAKIEINNRINTELENIAKNLYDYWFKQFDFPDINGKPYKSSGGKMIYNDKLKREIPEGWTDGSLDDLGKIVGGSTPSTNNSEHFTDAGMGISWITPNDLSNNLMNKFITNGAQDVTNQGIKNASLKIYPKGTVLLSTRAPIGYMSIARQELTTNQGFKSFIPNKRFSSAFIYYTLKTSMKAITQYASGSTFKEISGSVLKTVKICCPNIQIVEKYTVSVEPIFNRQDLLELENQQLSQLRDWLMPMLMNGQVKVN